MTEADWFASADPERMLGAGSAAREGMTMSAPLTPEQERAKAVLDTFWWGQGWRAGPTQIDAVADALRAFAAERTAALEAAGEQLADVVDSYMYRKLSRVCPEAALAAWRQARGGAGEGKG